MSELNICNDNRFELINKYKQELIEATNIESSPEEMAVLDSILFRFWQMGWLDKLEQKTVRCKDCKYFIPDEPCTGGTYTACDVLIDSDGCCRKVHEDFYCAYGERRKNE